MVETDMIYPVLEVVVVVAVTNLLTAVALM
jgi:hypothetical protein